MKEKIHRPDRTSAKGPSSSRRQSRSGEERSSDNSTPGVASYWSFSNISVYPRGVVQRKATIGAVGDRYEQEADRRAGEVMESRGAAAPTQAALPRESSRSPEAVSSPLERALRRRAGGGSPLPGAVRAFMEPRLGSDLSDVRVHTDSHAITANRRLHAQAFTCGRDIYFGPGKRPGNDALTAHELTHVLQQTAGDGARSGESSAGVPSVQRVVELRPPGRGEASAFGRRQELVDRLNRLSTAIQYRLEAAPVAPRERIAYTVVNEGALRHFDRQMRDFIDRTEVAPLRLITGAGRVSNGAGGFDPLLFDSYVSAYVDLEDLLASDDNAFQLVLLHFLTERLSTRNYERRIGIETGPGNLPASFDRAHRAGRDAEVAFLRDLLGDPTIRHNYDEEKPNGTLVVAWRSNEGYRVFHIIRHGAADVRGGEVSVQTADGRRLSIADFLAERRAAARRAVP
jgi:hypothetical protein